MKEVRVARIKECDICTALGYESGERPRPGEYDAPMSAEAQRLFGASWANLCVTHFDAYGLDTSVTTRLVQA